MKDIVERLLAVNQDVTQPWKLCAEAAATLRAKEERIAALEAERDYAVSEMKEAREYMRIETRHAEAAEERIAALEAYARKAIAAITGLAGGGSECFAKKIGDMYTADLPLCVERIRASQTRTHEWLLKTVKERKAAEAAEARAESRADRMARDWFEFCERMGVVPDTQEAVAYAINTKINNAEYDQRAAETNLSKAVEALKRIAAKADEYDPPEGDDDFIAWQTNFTIGDLRLARTALRELGGNDAN